jgi:hypothetical protein
MRLGRILPILGLALVGCAGDAGWKTEAPWRRDGWDVQMVGVHVVPAHTPAWCVAGNGHFEVQAGHSGEHLVLPLRGGELEVRCWNARGWRGSLSVVRDEGWGWLPGERWPERLEIRLLPRDGERPDGPAAPVGVAPLTRPRSR